MDTLKFERDSGVQADTLLLTQSAMSAPDSGVSMMSSMAGGASAFASASASATAATSSTGGGSSDPLRGSSATPMSDEPAAPSTSSRLSDFGISPRITEEEEEEEEEEDASDQVGTPDGDDDETRRRRRRRRRKKREKEKRTSPAASTREKSVSDLRAQLAELERRMDHFQAGLDAAATEGGEGGADDTELVRRFVSLFYYWVPPFLSPFDFPNPT